MALAAEARRQGANRRMRGQQSGGERQPKQLSGAGARAELIAARRSALVTMSFTAWNALGQNAVPLTATRMKAFRLINVTTFSRYHAQQRAQHMTNFKAAFFSCSSRVLRLTYSITRRTNCTTAMMKEPRAMEPRWYRQARWNAAAGGERGGYEWVGRLGSGDNNRAG